MVWDKGPQMTEEQFKCNRILQVENFLSEKINFNKNNRILIAT